MHEICFSHDAPPAPLIGWGGGNPHPIPHPPRRLQRLGLVAPANWGGSVSILQGGMEGPVAVSGFVSHGGLVSHHIVLHCSRSE